MKRAIVLAGGGTKGSYEVGVWRALNELGIDYQIVTGTSIGSINGVFMASGEYERGVYPLGYDPHGKYDGGWHQPDGDVRGDVGAKGCHPPVFKEIHEKQGRGYLSVQRFYRDDGG